MNRGSVLTGALFLSLWTATASPQEKLISEGDEWMYFKGTEQPPADWNTAAFDDSGWLAGATPIGYSVDLPYKTVLSDMQMAGANAGYLTVYSRKAFDVADPAAVKLLNLGLKYDDGLIAYLNGKEVVRKAMNAGDVTKDTAGLDHETNTTFEANFLACDMLSSLVKGKNVLAVEIHNVALTSSDCSFSAEVSSVTDACPTTLTCQLRPTGQVLVRWTKPMGLAYDALVLSRNGVALDPGPLKTATSFTDRTPAQGVNNYRLVATFCGTQCSGASVPECSVTVGEGGEPKFRRGDLDQNGSIGINDAVLLLNSLFRDGGPFQCPDAADADDNGEAQLTDAVFILRYLFQGGGALPPPLDTCGTDPTQDSLAACVFSSCP